MVIFAVLLALSSPSRAQIAPAGPSAVPEAKLDEIFRRFTSGRPMIPTLKEVQAENLRRDLAPRPEDAPASSATRPGLAPGSRPRPGERRETSESVDVAVSRPLPRLELGVGARETAVDVGSRRARNDTDGYAFARIDLSRSPLPRKLFHSPTAVRTETEVGERVRVTKDEYSIKSLPKP